MPQIEGIQVLEKIKSDNKFRKIPVIILTFSKETVDLDKCYELGVNAYVVKPVKLDEFIESVKKQAPSWQL
jgi:CheY-like chemotaxis protein